MIAEVARLEYETSSGSFDDVKFLQVAVVAQPATHFQNERGTSSV